MCICKFWCVGVVSKFTVMQLLVTCADTAIHFLIVLKIALTMLYLVCYSSEANHTKF